MVATQGTYLVDQAELEVAVGTLLRYALANDDLAVLLRTACEALVKAGVPVWRASLDIPTIDPNARAMAHKWWSDRPLTVVPLPHGPEQETVFRDSVIYYVMSRGLEVHRWRLDHDEGLDEFALLRELKAQGCTDYVLRLVGFGGDIALRGLALSFATKRVGGFTPDDLAAAERLVPAVGLGAYRMGLARTATETLNIYLGPRSARRVLGGEIIRGEGETIAAAILLVDLRGFTALTEREDALRVVGWLNEHFEAIGDVIASHGGEILKFVGDGLLAVFPATADATPCPDCDTALRAAMEGQAANRKLNEHRSARGEPTLDADAVLHFGEVVYGNVGASRRLDFTVIGRAVNEASRMEPLCAQLGCDLVISEAFARRCLTRFREVGSFPLRGIDGPRRVYTAG
jgi:adenylate cyclase